SFGYYAARQGIQPRIFIGGEVLAGKTTHRQIHSRWSLAKTFQNFEAGHIWQTQIENHAVERLLANRGQGLSSSRNRGDANIVAAQQFTNTELLSRTVLDNQ